MDWISRWSGCFQVKPLCVCWMFSLTWSPNWWSYTQICEFKPQNIGLEKRKRTCCLHHRRIPIVGWSVRLSLPVNMHLERWMTDCRQIKRYEEGNNELIKGLVDAYLRRSTRRLKKQYLFAQYNTYKYKYDTSTECVAICNACKNCEKLWKVLWKLLSRNRITANWFFKFLNWF